MCGITGFTGSDNLDLLKRMNKSLQHRGPDGEGFFCNGHVNLAMRRLAIIDLQTGDQPMFSEDKKIVVVFNGEIYNFEEIRKELMHKHQFVSSSDTEVIVHGYEEWGTDLFQKLNGMFAIAIWDGRAQKLILARDRMGQKPLFYTHVKDELVFASEPKAILVHPAVRRQLSFEAMRLYLSYEYVPAPLSIYEGIFKLEPGNFLVWQNKDISIHSYWHLEKVVEQDMDEMSALKKFDELMGSSVKMRLLSDVPLGVFLSGGIDSGAIAYYAQRFSSKPIKTFSIGFSDRSYDESSYARNVARDLGTEHYEEIFSEKQVSSFVPELAQMQDEPLGDASLFPTHLLSRFTRKHVTVALSGDGGDELLFGYPTFQMHKLERFYFALPKFIRKNFIDEIINSLPVSFDNITTEYGLKRFISSTDLERWQRDLIWIGSFSADQKQSLLTQSAKSSDNLFTENFAPMKRYFDSIHERDFLSRMSYVYLKSYLADDILQKTDRATMYASLEGRNPFMDWRVVEFLYSLPTQMKMKGLKTKYLFKKLLINKLPQQIIDRKKKGFGMPVASWLVGDLESMVKDSLLNKQFIAKQNLFNYATIEKLWFEHQQRKKNNRKELWTLLMFQLWYKNWLNK